MICSIAPNLQNIAQGENDDTTQSVVNSNQGVRSNNKASALRKSSDCWYTPPNIIELVVKVLGRIDLDPCADEGKHVPAQVHYTVMDNGLDRSWNGRVFMNPPYSCPGVWMSKLLNEFQTGRVKEAIALVSAATDTNWLSPVLDVQPVCFWKGRIKFLDENYQPKNSARQSHVLIYWGDNWQCFKQVFESYGVVKLPSAKGSGGLLGEIEDSPSKSPSNEISPSKRRACGEGSGSIYWRTITRGGKDYLQAYYHWKELGQKRTKYIPKNKLAMVQQAKSQKRPVIEILGLLGVVTSSSLLLGDTENSPSNDPSNEISPSEAVAVDGFPGISKLPFTSVERSAYPKGKRRRRKGEGSGSIHWRTITKNGKDYPQAYYHYEVWSQGNRIVKKSKYIPKQLLPFVEELDAAKVPTKEILQLLGVRTI
jgi:phage N-6-adenine-methyltransferase